MYISNKNFSKTSYIFVETKCKICQRTIFKIYGFSKKGKWTRYGFYTKNLWIQKRLKIFTDLSMMDITQIENRIIMKSYNYRANNEWRFSRVLFYLICEYVEGRTWRYEKYAIYGWNYKLERKEEKELPSK